MKRNRTCLLIGVTGFVGGHLANYLIKKGTKVIGTYHRRAKGTGLDKRVRLISLDVTKGHEMERLILRLHPDEVYYLAAQSSVREAWFDPIRTIQVNFLGGVQLLEILRRNRINIKLLIFSSGTTYGLSHGAGKSLDEEACIRPKDPYAVSKMALDFFARFYAKIYGLNTVVLRLANVIGPGQDTTFSLSNFAFQIVGIERGKLPREIRVGNLDAKRDYLDICDAVRAITLAMRYGVSGEAYNISSGRSRRLKDVLNEMCGLSKLDKARVRMVRQTSLRSKDEIPCIQLDSSKFRRLTGWRPQMAFRQSLKNILDDRRKRWEAARKE